MDKRECLKSMKIGQSAAKARIGQRSSTIPTGSTVIKNYRKKETCVYIYFLSCPYTGEIRYIGCTKRHPFQRLGEHFRMKANAPNQDLQNWLNNLQHWPTVKWKEYPKNLLHKANNCCRTRHTSFSAKHFTCLRW